MKRMFCRQFLCAVSATLFLLTPGCINTVMQSNPKHQKTDTNSETKSDTTAGTKSDSTAGTNSETTTVKVETSTAMDETTTAKAETTTAKAETKTAKADTKTTAKSQTSTAKANAKTTAKSQTKTTVKSETKTTAKPETKTTVKSETKTAAKPETKETTKVEISAKPLPAAKTGNDTIKVKLVRSLQSPEKLALLKEQKDILTMSIKAEKGDSDETALSAEIVQRMNGAMSRDIAITPDDGNCDLRVAVRPNLALVDRDNDYFRMSCSVGIEMKSADGKRIFGSSKIDLGAPRRVLGKEAAVAGFAEPAANSSVEWCRKELNRIVDAEIDISQVSFQLPAMPRGKERDLQKDAASIIRIGETLGKQKKILNYELISQDPRNGACIYRVVYFNSEYPNGLINELNALFGAAKQN